MEIYKDKNRRIDERVSDLLDKMTLKEKIGQLNQKMFGWKAYKIEKGEVILAEEFKDEVAFGDGVGAIYGPSRADGWNKAHTLGITAEESVRVANKLQRYIIETTRLGIPILISEECPHGVEALESTTFPTNIGIGSTWNPDLYEQVCSIMAKELRARGGHLGLISTLDIAQDPRWGRTEECYGEDPYLSARLCKSAVYGLQGRELEELKGDNKVVSVVKHFCGQGATIGGHNGRSTIIGNRELHEIHLQGMRRAVEAGALGCMAAYNDVDGVPCHISQYLLTHVLRDDMGFQGFVMSDGMGVDRLKSITGSHEKAGAYSLKAGVDLNLWNQSFIELEAAIVNGHLNEKDIDVATRRILKTKFSLGLFENPYVEEAMAKEIVGNQESQKIALEIAREVPVLLKNNGILPLGNNIKKIAVIGPNSDHIYNMLGDYTQWQEDSKVSTILQGIREQAGQGVVVEYAHGCSVRGYEKDGFKEAISIASEADVTLYVVGGSSSREVDAEFEDNGAFVIEKFTGELDCGEAVDLANLQLGGVQEELAYELQKLKTPLVTILIHGRPHAIPWFEEHADAILCGWYPGEKGGDAIGEILFGKISPSGKLPISFPVSSSQLPVFYNRKDSSRYIDMSAEPLYKFGYGLSYTTFEYSNCLVKNKRLSTEELKNGKRFNITFDITNKGDMDAKEIAQLYIYDMESCITRRVKELKDFTKVHILKNERVTLSLSVGIDELSIYDYQMDFVLEPGQVRLMIGASSENIIFEEIITIL